MNYMEQSDSESDVVTYESEIKKRRFDLSLLIKPNHTITPYVNNNINYLFHNANYKQFRKEFIAFHHKSQLETKDVELSDEYENYIIDIYNNYFFPNKQIQHIKVKKENSKDISLPYIFDIMQPRQYKVSLCKGNSNLDNRAYIIGHFIFREIPTINLMKLHTKIKNTYTNSLGEILYDKQNILITRIKEMYFEYLKYDYYCKDNKNVLITDFHMKQVCKSLFAFYKNSCDKLVDLINIDDSITTIMQFKEDVVNTYTTILDIYKNYCEIKHDLYIDEIEHHVNLYELDYLWDIVFEELINETRSFHYAQYCSIYKKHDKEKHLQKYKRYLFLLNKYNNDISVIEFTQSQIKQKQYYFYRTIVTLLIAYRNNLYKITPITCHPMHRNHFSDESIFSLYEEFISVIMQHIQSVQTGNRIDDKYEIDQYLSKFANHHNKIKAAAQQCVDLFPHDIVKKNYDITNSTNLITQLQQYSNTFYNLPNNISESEIIEVTTQQYHIYQLALNTIKKMIYNEYYIHHNLMHSAFTRVTNNQKYFLLHHSLTDKKFLKESYSDEYVETQQKIKRKEPLLKKKLIEYVQNNEINFLHNITLDHITENKYLIEYIHNKVQYKIWDLAKPLKAGEITFPEITADQLYIKYKNYYRNIIRYIKADYLYMPYYDLPREKRLRTGPIYDHYKLRALSQEQQKNVTSSAIFLKIREVINNIKDLLDNAPPQHLTLNNCFDWAASDNNSDTDDNRDTDNNSDTDDTFGKLKNFIRNIHRVYLENLLDTIGQFDDYSHEILKLLKLLQNNIKSYYHNAIEKEIPDIVEEVTKDILSELLENTKVYKEVCDNQLSIMKIKKFINILWS